MKNPETEKEMADQTGKLIAEPIVDVHSLAV
jgi:hypothetical protein